MLFRSRGSRGSRTARGAKLGRNERTLPDVTQLGLSHIVASQRQCVAAACELNLVIAHPAALECRCRPGEIESPHAKETVAHHRSDFPIMRQRPSIKLSLRQRIAHTQPFTTVTHQPNRNT